MKRALIDRVARDWRLDEAAVAVALEATGARPGRDDWRRFLSRLALGAGVASLAAAAIMFIAANWQSLAVVGRFALAHAAIVACAGVAFWRPPPHAMGRAALALAIVVSGALLALYGQAYQTGADLYELFFAWAGLTVVFAIAAASGAAWAIWWCVLNVGLALFAGTVPFGRGMWWWIDRWHPGSAEACLAIAAIDFAAAAGFARLHGTSLSAHAPRWLSRLLLAFAFGYGTAACLLALGEAPAPVVIGTFAVLSIAVGGLALRARSDVFPLAAIAGAWIVVTTVLLARALERGMSEGGIFLLALWVIGTSSATGFALMHWVRAWRVEEESGEATA
ncbi:MAG TPA: DUF2157 domain-containing protein [Usitatibacter sp.]|nr:DUF2157 domain-containing protein [Usitatibacter sp.]